MHPTIRDALVILAALETTAQQAYGSRDFYCRESVTGVHDFQSVNDVTLQHLLDAHPIAGEVHLYGTWLFLPAPRDGPLRIPILNVIYDYSVAPARVSLQAAVFYLTGDDSYATGWRFESPEMPGDDGNPSTHGFYHAQPGHSVRTLTGDHPLPVPERLIPVGQPTLPLDARDEVDLLVCLLVSIYGLTEAQALISNIQDTCLIDRLATLTCVP